MNKRCSIYLKQTLTVLYFICFCIPLSAIYVEKFPDTLTQYNGTINNIVIYISFSDQTEFSEKAIFYHNMFNNDEPNTASLYNFYKALSFNKTLVTSTFYPISSGNVIISYQDIHPHSYFQPYHAITNPNGYQGGLFGPEYTSREHNLLKRAIEFISEQVPEDLNIDINNDGRIDLITFIVRGTVGALLPHKWILNTEYAVINGKRVWNYTFQVEESLDLSATVVLYHETFHIIGTSPELYRSSNTGIPVGPWDLMASTSPLNPLTSTVYMRYKYGKWIDNIPEIYEAGVYTLNNVWADSNYAYKIPSPNSSTEYFIIEYHDTNIFWDSDLPGSGLIIYRINPACTGNLNGPPDEMYIFRPGGTTNFGSGNIKDAHFSKQTGRTVFNDSSNPPCFLSNNLPGGISICNISEAGGETMSFEISNSLLIVDNTDLVFEETFTGTTSEPQIINISGENLRGDITYTKEGQNAEMFDVDSSAFNPVIGGNLKIFFSPVSNKTYNATITIKSDCTPSKTISMKGYGVLAISEQLEEQIKVFPNPVTGLLTIETGKMSVIQLFSIEGSLIKEMSINTAGEINLSEYANSLYFLKIIDVITGTVISKKIVLER